MNYLDRIGQRRIEVVGEDMTITLNLENGTSHFGDRVEQLVCDRDTPIRDMHRAILERDGRDAHDFERGNAGVVSLSKTLPTPIVPIAPIARRQDAPACFDMNASIYVWRRDPFLRIPAYFMKIPWFTRCPQSNHTT